MSIELVFLLFALGGLALFRVVEPAVASLLVFLGGWLCLPVGHFPPGPQEAEFPYWIIGLALPSNMLLNKAWVAPATAVLGVLLFDREAFRRLRPAKADAVVLLWCLWPLLQGVVVDATRPPGWIASAYLFGCWGLPWLLGRLYFGSPAGQVLLLKGFAVAGVACLPFAVIEGLQGAVSYRFLYEVHPFEFDEGGRYFGYRPLGTFESGNQYGIWVCICALAAVWLAVGPFVSGSRPALRRVIAGVAVLIALVAQSVGALVLLFAALPVLAATGAVRARRLLVPPLAALLLGGFVYLSGAVPIARLAAETAVGQQVVQVFRSAGRQSFTWRISQDQKQLRAALANPVAGTADWAWWRKEGTRPWGLPLLVVGQFGLVGLVLAFTTLIGSAVAAVWRAPAGTPWSPGAAPLVLAVTIGMAVGDALLNSFLFFPALLAAGALATGGLHAPAVAGVRGSRRARRRGP